MADRQMPSLRGGPASSSVDGSTGGKAGGPCRGAGCDATRAGPQRRRRFTDQPSNAEPAGVTRQIVTRVILLLVAAGSLYLLLPQILDVFSSWPQLRGIKPAWLGLAVFFEAMASSRCGRCSGSRSERAAGSPSAPRSSLRTPPAASSRVAERPRARCSTACSCVLGCPASGWRPV